MGRIYAVTFENVTLTASGTDQDLFYIAPADDKPVSIHAMALSNVAGTADAGDAQEELLRLAVMRGHATVGSGGAAATARPVIPNDGAAGFTARTNDTTIASAGTAVNLHCDGWNNRIPYQWIWTPETRPVCSQVEVTIVVRLLSTLADDMPCSGTLYVEELV